MKVVRLLFACVGFFLSFPGTAEILLTRLSDEAYLLKAANYSTNIALLKTGKGIVLIDPMPGKEKLDALNQAIRTMYPDSPLYLLNTHQHEDHTGGNDYFQKTGALLLDSTEKLTDIKKLDVKSHSGADSIFFHSTSNTIFVGDIYDTDWHPTFYAGGIEGFVAAVDSVLALGDERSLIVPGHGKPTGKGELRAFKQNTLDWVSQVKVLKDRGLALSEMKRDKQLTLIFERFNVTGRAVFVTEKAFVRFIERTLTMVEQAK